MPAQTHKATGKPLLALLVAILAATLFMTSCGTNTDGDLNAYCDVIAKNLDLGIPDTNLPIDELDLLITLAPSEVKKIVTKKNWIIFIILTLLAFLGLHEQNYLVLLSIHHSFQTLEI